MVKLERKNIEKFSSHDSDETNLKATEGKSGKFDLKLGSLLVGTLLYNGNIWQFSYSEEFKNANSIPLVNFPSKDKVYESSQLWPFFASRLPGNAQLDADSSRDDIVILLQKYGRHVITNPYVLAD